MQLKGPPTNNKEQETHTHYLYLVKRSGRRYDWNEVLLQLLLPHFLMGGFSLNGRFTFFLIIFTPQGAHKLSFGVNVSTD